MRRDGPSDKTIVRRARQGDRQAFLTLLRRYDPRLRRLALRLLADPARVDRVLSRAYMKAWRSLPFFKRGEPVAGWLYRIVYNGCINEMRWEPSRAAPDPPPEGTVLLFTASGERRLLALRALNVTERVPLVLVDGEGFSLEAAARIMRRDLEHVAADLTRARGRWRSFVTGEPEGMVLDDEDPVVVEPSAETENGAGGPPERSPAATMAALATLAVPTASREPGGHVRVLAGGATTLPPRKPVAPARLRPIERPDDPSRPPGPGDHELSEAARSQPPPDGDETPARDNGASADPDETAEAPTEDGASGAGARRRRRRDAKRATRPRRPTTESGSDDEAVSERRARPGSGAAGNGKIAGSSGNGRSGKPGADGARSPRRSAGSSTRRSGAGSDENETGRS